MTAIEHTPHLVLLMGVAGSGKSTLGRLLAERLGYAFLDADDFHSPEAVTLMRAGQPLTDVLRDAWVDRLQAALTRRYQQGTSCVMAFSGLRAKHRKRLGQIGFTISAFMLQGSAELLTRRLAQRQGHFMPVTQLEAQLTAMQAVEADEQIELVNIDALTENIVDALAAKCAAKI